MCVPTIENTKQALSDMLFCCSTSDCREVLLPRLAAILWAPKSPMLLELRSRLVMVLLTHRDAASAVAPASAMLFQAMPTVCKVQWGFKSKLARELAPFASIRLLFR